MLGGKILDYRVGAALAEIIVIFRAARGVRAAFQRDDESLGVRNFLGQLVQGFLIFLG